MARIVNPPAKKTARSALFEKAVKRMVQVGREMPPLNLLNGKFLNKTPKDDADYTAHYSLQLRLVVDDSPIQRAALVLVNDKRKQQVSSIILPVVYWKELRELLGEFMGEAEEELGRRGERPSRFKLKKKRRE